ncbi:MAG: DUF4038 domain-containing protein [Oscillospiraceae bacterium]|nr:DUF4038 domain-containing protein [Oscillospiraceae bacterium]
MIDTARFPASCERWDVYEISLPGRADGNPFTDWTIWGEFRGPGDVKRVSGFYDGNGVYRVRFMPCAEGRYTFTVSGTFSDRVWEGSFETLPASAGNHGVVRVRNRYHLAYDDGTPHYSVGTTCYAFALQAPEIVEQTFDELGRSGFNKLRFCLMPKHYDFSLRDPVAFPYEGTPMDASVLTRENFAEYTGNPPGNDWDFTRFNPEFFRLYDRMIGRLLEMGIEADIILFHAYDRWGFSQMPMDANERYIRYVAARYSAYRNVWWGLANEYELLPGLSGHWEELAQILVDSDPWGHLRSIHNCETFYDYSRPWITHCSCQRCDHHKTTEDTDELRRRYGKPVIWDEVGYEGDFPHCWGNFTPEELVRRAWEAAIRGGYCGHSETFLSDDGIVWWAHGGRLKGESAERFDFLRKFLEDVPGCGLKLGKLRDDVHFQWDDYVAIPEDPALEGTYYFFYYSIWRPPFRQIYIDDTTLFEAEAIDTWNMTVTPLGRFRGRTELPLPGTQYCGIRVRAVEEG